MTNNNYQRLIEVLGENQKLSECGQCYICGGYRCDCVCYLPILIGEIAFKIAEKYHKEEINPIKPFDWSDFSYSQVPELFELWLPFRGRSLQEIVEGSGWETTPCNHRGLIDNETCYPYPCGEKRIKSPQARNLIDFLTSIFLTTKI